MGVRVCACSARFFRGAAGLAAFILAMLTATTQQLYNGMWSHPSRGFNVLFRIQLSISGCTVVYFATRLGAQYARGDLERRALWVHALRRNLSAHDMPPLPPSNW